MSYIKASVMKENDLERLAAEEARAAFVLSDWLSGQTQEEDSKAIVRTLMLNNYSPRCPVYVQLSEPHSTYQLSLSPGTSLPSLPPSLLLSLVALFIYIFPSVTPLSSYPYPQVRPSLPPSLPFFPTSKPTYSSSLPPSLPPSPRQSRPLLRLP